jgi:hypothetical protein
VSLNKRKHLPQFYSKPLVLQVKGKNIPLLSKQAQKKEKDLTLESKDAEYGEDGGLACSYIPRLRRSGE